MDYNRRRSNIKKYQMNNKGIALITALSLAIVVLIILAGLYYFMVNFFGISQNIKVYSSTRDAAIGGINYGVTLIYQNKAPQNYSCNTFITKYKLSNDNNYYQNTITICLIGYEASPGTQITGVAYSQPQAGNKGNIYSIISIANGPNNTQSRIESIYKP